MAASKVSHRGILKPQQAAEHFTLSRYPPSPELAPFVERYWMVHWDLRGRDPYVQETLPHPCVNFTLVAGYSGVHGIDTKKTFRVVLEGEGHVVGTKFRPGGFYPFVKYPISELTDRVLSVAEAFSTEQNIESAVLAEPTHEAQLARVEAFLLSLRPERDENVDLVSDIVLHAQDHPSITRVEELTEAVGMSLRNMQRLFQRYVGVSPKWVIRRYRMHDAVERIAEGREVDWIAMANELGYFDQAHFIKDFRAQMGRSPTEYEAAVRAASA